MRRKVVLGAVGIVVVLVAAVWWFVLRDTAPPAPDIDRATQVAADAQATTSEAPATTAPATTAPATTSEAPATTASTTTEASTTTTTSTTTEAPIPGPSGTWTVDTSIGSFSDFTSSYVGFRVEEELARGIGHVEAVGRTPVVDGWFELDGDTLVAAEITADLSSIRTDRAGRDGKVKQALDTGTHPEAVFTLTGPVQLVGLPAPGDESATQIDVIAPGSLTIKGTTNEVELDLKASLVGEIVTVVGTFDIVFADYGVEAPTAPIVVSVEDHGVVEIQLFLTR